MKTKVIAFRVTQDEYALLAELTDEMGNVPFRKLFEPVIAERLNEARELIKRREKAQRAKAKREAKKAAANGAQ